MEHYALLRERDRLKEKARHRPHAGDRARTEEQLEAEMSELNARLDHEVMERTGFVTGKGGNNAGASPGAWVQLGARAREASGAGRIQARIGQIEEELERRRAH